MDRTIFRDVGIIMLTLSASTNTVGLFFWGAEFSLQIITVSCIIALISALVYVLVSVYIARTFFESDLEIMKCFLDENRGDESIPRDVYNIISATYNAAAHGDTHGNRPSKYAVGMHLSGIALGLKASDPENRAVQPISNLADRLHQYRDR